MRIMAVGDRFSGVSYHRLFLPIAFLKREKAFFSDTLYEKELAEGYDIVLINRCIFEENKVNPIHDVMQVKAKYGFKLVVDVDDYWNLDQWHILKHGYPTQQIMDYIMAADMVTTTNEKLRDRILSINKNVYVVPNALPFGQDQFINDIVPTEGIEGRCRFVYAGGVTHQRDLDILHNPMKRVATDTELNKLTHFTICGYDGSNARSKDIWDRMVHNYTAGLKVSCHVKSALPVAQYMNFYAESDAALVPLVGSEFNSMKSNLKVLEAACKKIPVIASDVSPYAECPHVLKVSKQGDWYKHIKTLAKSEAVRKSIGTANYEWATENHNLHKWNEVREQLFKSLI